MKFSEMKYERPDFAKVYAELEKLCQELKEAPSEERFFEIGEEIDRVTDRLGTQATLANVRHTIDTRDKFYDEEVNVLDQEMPRFSEVSTNIAKVILASPYREAFEKRYGHYQIQKLEAGIKTFKPEILEDLVLENQLGTQYTKLIASAEIEFDGKTYNLTGLGPFTQSLDREVRKRASEAMNGWLAEHMTELDRLYDELVKVRDRIGQKLGFENFIPVAYARMSRCDWDYKDAQVYREQIAKEVVPLVRKLVAEQKERIGVDHMMYYDMPLNFVSGNPTPQGDEPVLVEAASKMYHELSELTGQFFDIMRRQELMDLSNKPGKAGGGYMTFLPDYGVPFIFSNFNGTSHDVDVLTHEAGHAFQGWLQRDVKPRLLSSFTMEVAEIHSMSMEFFTHPWMEQFFGPDTEKYYYDHVAQALRFLPYGASIDEFQEWVYTHVDATPEERRAAYREIEKKYLPELDYSGNDYLESGGRWQRQGHVYGMPFYYLDYTLAQVIALQYFLWDQKDHEAAWESYLKICREAGLKPFTELVVDCGLKNPFNDGCIASITPGLERYMASLDQSQIK